MGERSSVGRVFDAVLWVLTLGLGALYVPYPPVWETHGMLFLWIRLVLALFWEGDFGPALFMLLLALFAVAVLISEAWALANLIWLPARPFFRHLVAPRSAPGPAPTRIGGRLAAFWLDESSRIVIWFLALTILAGYLAITWFATEFARRGPAH